MADPFVAEIRIFPFNFAPKGWAFCDGQLLPISQNTALFSLVGTYYGGDGKSTFALPNLQGRVPIHVGQGQGLSQYDLGQEGGAGFVTLLQSELPAHSHAAMADTLGDADTNVPAPVTAFAKSTNGTLYQSAQDTTLAQGALIPQGSSQPHNNLMPLLTLSFCIALQGVFPPRG
jgi:microcystin-dependent protein